MVLSISAAALHLIAYLLYLQQVYDGGSVPNPASWTIWVLLGALDALTFWKGTDDALASSQYFVGAVAAVVIWGYGIVEGKFAPLDTLAWVTLVLCFTAVAVWHCTGSAVYANIFVGGIIVLSFVPTYAGVWRNSHSEQPLPWLLWTVAFAVTAVNVCRRTDRAKPGWWLMTLTPIAMVILHCAVAVLAVV